MWSRNYQRLSRLKTHGGSVAEVAHCDGMLYFARRKKGERVKDCSPRAIPMLNIPATQICEDGSVMLFESAGAGGLYLLCGDFILRTHDSSHTWEHV